MAKILIVDDSKELLEMLTLLLKMNGHKVMACENKEEAFKSIVSFPPDLILIDVWFGNKSGKDLCVEIKKTKKNLPILLMSANPEVLTSSKAECMADEVLEKPFDIREINETINRLLANSFPC